MAVAEAPGETTSTARVYDAIYDAILEGRLTPGARLREVELAESFDVSRTLVRQALQRLAQDQLVDLQHNRGAQVMAPTAEAAAHIFDARRVVECDVAKRLGGKLSVQQLATLRALVAAEAAAALAGDWAGAIRLSGQFHRALVQIDGNPVFLRLLDELLPTTSLLMALHDAPRQPACVAHRHVDVLAAFERSGTVAAAEMRKHLVEIEKSLLPRKPFERYRELSETE